MRKILQWRWAIFAVWIVSAVLLTVFQPDINAILKQRGQGQLSADTPSKIAESILNKMRTTKGNEELIVFYDKNKLSDDDMKQIQTGIQEIQKSKTELGVGDIIDPFSKPDAKSSLLSKDGTTLLVSFKLDVKGRDIDNIQKALDKKLKDVKVTYYLTGTDFINNDYAKLSISGVEKSGVLTVGFILVILVIMFRSVVTPLASLLAVGLSYLCSMGIAAQLIEKLDFPVTSLTQLLLILILFGVGTDYNILLFNRFREEMSHGHSVDDAIIITYKTAGKTIFYSILTVFIAFVSLVFAKFDIYQSGTVVAIGTAIFLLQILTFTSVLMKVFGNKLFWPSKTSSGHRENKFWDKITSVSVKYPLIAILLILGLTAPVIYFNKQNISFDSLKELGASSPAAKGFNLVSEHFGKGQAMPTIIAIENDEALDNNEAMAVLDKLTEDIKDIAGVEKVSSVTQPAAEPIKDFYISSQTETTTKGMDATKDGVNRISDGLNQMSSKLNTPDFSSVNDLINGTGGIETGLGSITDGLSQIDNGIEQGASGAAGLSDGIGKVKTGLSTISSKTSEVANGLSSLQGGYVKVRNGYKSIEQQLPAIQQGLGGMNQLIGALGKKYPEQLASDEQYLTLKQTGASLASGLAQLNGGIVELGKNYDTLNSNFLTTNKGLKQLAAAQKKMVSGLDELQKGAVTLSDGLKKGSAGQKTIITNMAKLKSGVSKIKDGQQQLSDGLSKLSGGMGHLKDGINKSSNGLGDISDGLEKTNKYLIQLKDSKTFFIPKEALTSDDFKKAINNYMSADRKITKITVVLKDDPYSTNALKTAEKINDVVVNGLKGTALADAKFGTGGPSSSSNDMSKVLKDDLNRMRVIILVSVFIVLVLTIRSISIPIYIVGSIIGAYYIGMTVANFVAYDVLKLDGVSSYMPFFTFIVIVSMGVDYSIFLMMRFKEYPDLSPKEAIVQASKHIGGVIMSAGIILAGTFATLIPSGLALLIEMGTAVIVGIVALCIIFLPIFVPALIALPDFIKRFTK
ncbi:MMPL family transporter [Rummeliibacillus pycnus]|uniref:MMPL family transporter n=1 Tax=Rummeliibacillus pycnus TaxID=101070 RepID=UPI003D2794C6